MQKTFCDICGKEVDWAKFYINIMEKCLGESPTYHRQYDDICELCNKAIQEAIDRIKEK